MCGDISTELSKMAESRDQNCPFEIPLKCGFSTRASLRIPNGTEGRESVSASRKMGGQKSSPLLLVFLSMYKAIHEWLARTISLPALVIAPILNRYDYLERCSMCCLSAFLTKHSGNRLGIACIPLLRRAYIVPTIDPRITGIIT